MLDLEVVPERSLGCDNWEFILGEHTHDLNYVRQTSLATCRVAPVADISSALWPFVSIGLCLRWTRSQPHGERTGVQQCAHSPSMCVSLYIELQTTHRISNRIRAGSLSCSSSLLYYVACALSGERASECKGEGASGREREREVNSACTRHGLLFTNTTHAHSRANMELLACASLELPDVLINGRALIY